MFQTSAYYLSVLYKDFYKQNFVSKLWGEEKYKWEAVKWFQDNWEVNAPD